MKRVFSCRVKPGAFWVALLFPLLLSSCQSLQRDESLKDWANVTLRVSGSGAVPKEWSIVDRIHAIQQAKIDAYAQLESKILKLKTDSRKTILELSKEDEEIRPKVSAFVRGAKIIQTRNEPSGVRIVAELFLGEHFKATIGLSERKTSPPSSRQRESSRRP